ncbi:hypothetical protein JCM18899A_12460 [Nocardioides sp. AN3]
MARHALIHRHHHDAAASETAHDMGDRVDDRVDDRTADDSAVERRAHVVPVTPRDRFGGTNWGACFFGWLVAVGVTVLLAAITSAIATAVGANLNWSMRDAESNPGTVGLAAAIAIAVIMFVGYYAGGYVAGRMSRFDGARQGLGVWLIGLVTLAIAVVASAVFGSRYDVLQRLDLPSLDISGNQLTWGAIVTAVVLLAVMLLGALLGSAVGRRYHRRIDAVIVEH